MKNLIRSSFQTTTKPTGFFLFLSRFLIGAFFFASGYNKLFTTAGQLRMLETITEAGIPYPEYMALFVAGVEVVAGALLAIGLLSRLSALMLFIISLVALLTVGLHQIPDEVDYLTWYSWLLYLPETLYMIILSAIVVQGCGSCGFDQLIAKKSKSRRYY